MKHLKTLFACLVMLFFTIGQVWAADTNTPTSGSQYRLKAVKTGTGAGTYYMVAPTSSGLGGATTTEADGTVFTFTKESSNWYVTFTNNSTTYYMYEHSDNGKVNISTTKTAVVIGTNGNYVKIGSSKWIQFNYNSGNPRVGAYSSNQTGVVLSEVAASSEPTVSLNPSSLTNLAATDVEDQEVTVTCTNFASDITSITTALFDNAECSGDAITSGAWVTDITVNDAKTKVSFKVADNDGAARQVWLKVTATDGSSTESAILPISQKVYVAPLTTMDAIYAAATEAGSTATNVTITFNNWVVSGKTNSNAYLTDGTKGLIIYASGHGFAVGDKLSGTVDCKVQLYNGAAELTTLTSSTTGLTVTTGGEITPVELNAAGIAALSGVNTGSVINVRGKCTYESSKYYVAGVQLYNTLYTYSVEAGKTYDATGVYVQYNSTKEMLPRSKDDIEEIPTPTVTVKDNESETITEMAFGNVGQRWQQSFVFGFSYENLEAGDLTMTIGGTNASAFAFYGGELTETVNISSAGSGSVSSLSFRQATEEVGDYEATLTFTGCGLLSPVVIPITMSVKAPEFTYTPATIAFGDVKQHTKATETFTLTGKYLKKNGSSNVKMLSTGIFDPLSEAETYFISSDENGEINETVTVTCDATDAVAGDAAGKLTLKSMELIPEFADKEEVVSFSATVVATYKIEVISPASTGGYVSINGGEPDARVEIYVVDGDEEVTITAHPNLGYAFSSWQKGGWPATIADATLATTTVTATGASTINAYFEEVCSPLNAPYLPQSLSTTYNSADLKWQWVLYDDESKVATFHLKATEVNTTNVIEKDITFTTEELAESDAYYTLTDPELKANTEYEFQVWATTTRDGYCEEGTKSIEASFTTAPYPAATLTLSENGVERSWGEDLRLASEVTLPAAPATNIVDKVFIGWITESSYSHATDAPANIKKAGEKYTVAAVADKLYAVYATATPGAITTIFSQNFNTCDGTGGNDGSWSGSIASKDLPVLTGWTFVSGNAAYQCVKLGASKAQGSAETPAITMSSNGTLTFRAGAWNSSEESTTLNISATNATLNKSSVTLTKGAFNTFSAAVTDIKGNVKIKFEAANASKNRFFLDDVVIESQAPTTYSNYVTSGPKLLALPTFDPEESETVYTEALEVEISAAEGTIHYTTDGTDPTSESPTYSSAITLNKYGVNTVKAIAIDGDNKSNIATANYTLDLPFASFEDLVDAKLYNGDDGTNVIVSFENVEITVLDTKEAYLNVKGSDETDISIFCSPAVHPEGWVVGGKLSGTSIAGTWRANIEFNDYLSISSWTGITYTKPASGLAWSAASATVKKGAKAAMNVYPTLTKPEDLTATIAYSSTDETVATIAANGSITLLKAGETTIKAKFENDDKYADAEVGYTLTVQPQGSVTVTPATLNYGKVKTGTASVNIDVLDFQIEGANLTGGRAVSIAAPAGFSVTATQLWPRNDGTLSENAYYITVNIDDATLNTAGVYDGNVVISSNDLAEDVIVAVKLTVEDAYAISVTSEGGWIEWNGSATAPESAFAGTEYTLEAKHDMSHEGGSIKVYKASDDSEVPEEVFDGTTLTMPAYAIKVVATFLLPAANISWASTEPLILTKSQASTYSNWRTLNNTGGFTVTVTSSNKDVIATMQPYGSSTTSTIWFPSAVLSTGTTTITATFAGNANYRETSVSYEVEIQKGDVDLAWSAEEFTAKLHVANTYPALTNTEVVDVSFESTNTAAATINATTGAISLVAPGTTTIKAIYAGDDNYNAKTVTYELTVALPVVKVAGNFTNPTWEGGALTLTPAEDGKTASAKYEFSADTWPQFKMIVDGVWRGLPKDGSSNLYTLNRDWTYENVTGTGDNIQLKADLTGEYTFTWEYESSKLEITFPAADYYIAGEFTNWETNKVKMTEDAGAYVATINITEVAEQPFKVIRFVGETKTWYGLENYSAMTSANCENWVIGGGQANIGLDVTKTGDYKFVFTPGENKLTVIYPTGGGTALGNTADETKAVKFLENGQIFILRGDKVYTVDGQLVK